MGGTNDGLAENDVNYDHFFLNALRPSVDSVSVSKQKGAKVAKKCKEY